MIDMHTNATLWYMHTSNGVISYIISLFASEIFRDVICIFNFCVFRILEFNCCNTIKKQTNHRKICYEEKS